MSEFSTEGKLQSTIDFGFQVAARDFASESRPTDGLRDFFASDDYYTDADSNAYAQPTFLGNHDMGRIGHFLQVDGDRARAPIRRRAAGQVTAGHALMFFSRGQPVVYYGDEQGFTGDGGDKDAREDMFANPVAVVRRQRPHRHRRDHRRRQLRPQPSVVPDHPGPGPADDADPALQAGAQIHRYSTDGPGVYAFSRIDRDERIEYVVALNNGEAAGHRDRAHVLGRRPRYDLVARSPGGGRGASSIRTRPRRADRDRAAAGLHGLPGRGTGAGQRGGARHHDHQPPRRRHRSNARRQPVGRPCDRPAHRGGRRARRRRDGRGDLRRPRGRRRVRPDRDRRQRPYRVFYDVSHLRGEPDDAVVPPS